MFDRQWVFYILHCFIHKDITKNETVKRNKWNIFVIDFIHFFQFRNPLEQLRNELNKLDTQINKIQTQMKAPNTHPDVKQQMSNFLPVR